MSNVFLIDQGVSSNTLTVNADSTFTGSFTLDGYSIDPTNATTGQVLAYDGYAYKPSTLLQQPQFNFGDGYDGALHITSGTTLLTRDMYYTTVLIDSGAVLDPQGCKVFATTSITNNGTISRNGNNGSVGHTNGSGGLAGILNFTSLPFATLPVCSQAAGNSFGIGSGGSNGSSVTYVIPPRIFSDHSYAPAHGGNGGGGGTSIVSGTASWVRWQQHTFISSLYACSIPGVGGSGGNGGEVGEGGSGGEGGGCIGLYSPIVINNGAIIAAGGNGGNAGSALSLSSNGGGGGGGGGMGGFIQVISSTTPSGSGAWDVSGGSGGNGGSADTAHGGIVGDPGSNGDGGTIQFHSLDANTIITYSPTH